MSLATNNYFNEESKVTRHFAAQCSMFTYNLDSKMNIQTVQTIHCFLHLFSFLIKFDSSHRRLCSLYMSCTCTSNSYMKYRLKVEYTSSVTKV